MFIIVFGSLPALHPLWERLFHFVGSMLASDERDHSGGYSGGYSGPALANYRRQLSSSETDRPVYHDESSVPDVEFVRLTDHPAQPQPVAAAVPRKSGGEDVFETCGVDHNRRIHVHRQVDVTSERSLNGQLPPVYTVERLHTWAPQRFEFRTKVRDGDCEGRENSVCDF